MVARYLVRAIDDPSDDEARGQMLLAATFAGIGFGNAGSTCPTGCRTRSRGWSATTSPTGYPGRRPLIPHGMSVILNAPAVFRFTAPADPARHLEAARLMGADIAGARPEDAGEILAGAIIALMQRTGMPNGLKAVGYGPEDVDALVAGTMVQHRVTKLSPRPASEADLKELFLELDDAVVKRGETQQRCYRGPFGATRGALSARSAYHLPGVVMPVGGVLPLQERGIDPPLAVVAAVLVQATEAR